MANCTQVSSPKLRTPPVGVAPPAYLKGAISGRSATGFQFEPAASLSSVFEAALVPVSWNRLQPRSPLAWPLSISKKNSLTRKAGNTPASTLTGSVDLPARTSLAKVPSVKLPEPPLP